MIRPGLLMPRAAFLPLLAVFVVMSNRAAADAVDPMNHADHFYQVTDVGALEARDGRVLFKKTRSGDAFVRWSMTPPRFMELEQGVDCLEIDFAAFPDGGAVQVLVALQGENGRKAIPWLNNYDKVGRATIPSLQALANEHGLGELRKLHLFFRVKKDPRGGVEFDRIRLGAEPSKTPFGADQGSAPSKQAHPSVTFDASPRENGMTFDRGGVKHVELPRGGGTEHAWVAEKFFGQGKRYQRIFRFNITDPVFADGGRRSIDIEVTYMLNAWGGVQVIVATDEGPQEVASLWGDCRGQWKTATVRVDNARLNDAIEGRFDIKLAGANGPLKIKRIRVVGYDPKENVMWGRLLEVKERGAINSAYEPVFAFHPDQQAGLRFLIANHADIPSKMERRLTIYDIQGHSMHQHREPAVLPPGEETELTIPFAIKNWPLGAYTVHVELAPVDADNDASALSFKTLVGVVSEKELGKARLGEFRFGLDCGKGATTPEALAFFDLMGVDRLRSALQGDPQRLDIDALRTAHEKLAEHGVTAMVMADPPGQMNKVDEAKRLQLLAERVVHLETLARELAPLVTYYELGNEPDLPFFYPHSPEAYVDAMHQMSEAIHRGNPDAITMNGGLCFHGETGDRRARRIVELTDISKFDMWAYHGHGVGGEAERRAYERQVEATKAHGKHTLPMLDTETGLNASRAGPYGCAENGLRPLQGHAVAHVFPLVHAPEQRRQRLHAYAQSHRAPAGDHGLSRHGRATAPRSLFAQRRIR